MLDDWRRHVLASVAFCFVSNSVLVRFLYSSALKEKDLQEVCRDAPRDRRSPVPELAYCSLQTFPISVTLSYRVLVCYNGIRSFFHAHDLFTESDPQSIAPTFVDGLFEGSWSLI